MIPRLKSLNCLTGDGELILSFNPRTRVRLSDPDGRVLAMLHLLREGTRDVDGLAVELAAGWPDTTVADIRAAVADLDRLGWLERADVESPFSDSEQLRYASNLAFFDAFSSLTNSSADVQTRLRGSHVLVLGAGGLGSAVLMNLAGLGVGTLTVADQDHVELRNFARQFTYRPADLGAPKADRVADWLRAFDPTLTVHSSQQRIENPQHVADLLESGDRVDFVVSAIDEPDDIDRWVNQACVAAGVPFVRGGLAHTQGLYWSVDPGRSACRECLERHRARLTDGIDREAATWPRVIRQDRVNRAIGPVAGLLGALLAMEALRYLTGLTPPVAAGRYQLVDFAAECGTSNDPWRADPDCPICATAPGRQQHALQGSR